MISISIFSFLVGATLAQRFKVVALIPAMIIVMILAAVIASSPPQGIWWFVEIAAAALASLQSGFFVGMLARNFIAADSTKASPQLSPAESSTHHAAHY